MIISTTIGTTEINNTFTFLLWDVLYIKIMALILGSKQCSLTIITSQETNTSQWFLGGGGLWKAQGIATAQNNSSSSTNFVLRYCWKFNSYQLTKSLFASVTHALLILYIPSHWNDPSWFWHLIIHLSKCRGHLVGECSGYYHDITLSGTGSEDHSKPVQVVPSSTNMHHLNSTASQSKCHGPKRTLLNND